MYTDVESDDSELPSVDFLLKDNCCKIPKPDKMIHNEMLLDSDSDTGIANFAIISSDSIFIM